MSSPASASGATRPGWHDRGRDRLAAVPLRTRMMVAMISLLAVVILVVGAISAVLLRQYLMNQLDAQVSVTASRLIAANRSSANHDQHGGSSRHDNSGSGADFLANTRVPTGTVGAIIVDGEIQSAGVIEKDSPSDLVGYDRQLLALPTDHHPHTEQLEGLGDYRMLALSKGDRTLVTGLPLAGVKETLASLALIELTVAGGGLVLAGLASTLVVRATLRPLSRVVTTAGKVSELRLDRGEVALAERVPARDTDPRTEVGQVGSALNRMLDHVGSALEARQASETQLRQFLADASHELRTPLAAIRGYAELTRRSAEDSMPPDVAHSLRRINSQAERMTSLVEDMLLLARLDAGRPLVRESVDLSQLVVDGVSDAHAAGPEHRWRLALPDEAVIVVGDATRLAQVLANLLTNARVHTPPGTTVLAELDRTSEEAVIRVVDDGPGIPPGLVPQVFGRFARGDNSRSRAAGSTGLGLAIARAVVTAHGGRVGVESVPGRTVFTVLLPVEQAYAEDSAPSGQRSTLAASGAKAILDPVPKSGRPLESGH